MGFVQSKEGKLKSLSSKQAKCLQKVKFVKNLEKTFQLYKKETVANVWKMEKGDTKVDDKTIASLLIK